MEVGAFGRMLVGVFSTKVAKGRVEMKGSYSSLLPLEGGEFDVLLTHRREGRKPLLSISSTICIQHLLFLCSVNSMRTIGSGRKSMPIRFVAFWMHGVRLCHSTKGELQKPLFVVSSDGCAAAFHRRARTREFDNY